MPGHAAGIDLGGTKVQGVIVDEAGTLLGSAVASTPGDGGPASVVDQVAAVVRAAAANAGIGVDDLDGVGMGSAGTVSPAAGVVLEAGNLSGFDRPVPLARLVAGAVALDPPMVRLENDVNVATLAEYRTGAGRGLDSLLAVFAGTGVGGAVVLGGRLHRGARGAAGELGHAVVVMGGDALAAELVELAARALGTAIASACNLLDVQGVLLGGGLTDGLGDPFVRLVERAVTPQLLANEPPLEIRRSALGDMAGAIGAALLVHEPPSPS